MTIAVLLFILAGILGVVAVLVVNHPIHSRLLAGAVAALAFGLVATALGA